MKIITTLKLHSRTLLIKTNSYRSTFMIVSRGKKLIWHFFATAYNSNTTRTFTNSETFLFDHLIIFCCHFCAPKGHFDII